MTNKILAGILAVLLIGILASLPSVGTTRWIDNQLCFYTGERYVEIVSLEHHEKLIKVYGGSK